MNQKVWARSGLALVITLITSIAAAAEDSAVGLAVAPCKSDDKAHASCGIGLRACSGENAAIPDINKNVEGYINKKIEGYYRGWDIDLEKTKDWGSPQGTAYPGPVCNIAKGEVENHNVGAKTSCGNFLHFSSSGVDATNGNGAREYAYRLGTWNQALLCHAKQVQNELIEKKKIKLSAKCQLLGEDVVKLHQTISQLTEGIAGSSGLDKAFCSQAESKAVDYCDPAILEKSSDPHANKEGTKHLQAACYINSARAQIEAAYAYALTCEVMARAEGAYDQAFVAHADKFEKRVKDLSNLCQSESQSYAKEEKCLGVKIAGKKIQKCWDVVNTGKYYSKFNECYQREYKKLSENVSNELFPASGQCQANGLQ